jgi:hypothetical protein
VLGFLFAVPAYGLFGPMIYDGPCSGVWGPIEIQCYIPDAIYAALSVWIPAVIFRKRASKVAFLSAISFLGICIILGTLFGNPLSFFQKTYYRPSILGVWISIWSVIISAILIYMLMHGIKKVVNKEKKT